MTYTRILGGVVVGAWMLAHGASAQVCTGDCNGDGRVRVDELVTAVTIALGGTAAGECPAAACDPNPLSIACLVDAVNNALDDAECLHEEPCPGLWCEQTGVCELACAEFLTADVDGKRMTCLASMCLWSDAALASCVRHLVASGEADCVPAL